MNLVRPKRWIYVRRIKCSKLNALLSYLTFPILPDLLWTKKKLLKKEKKEYIIVYTNEFNLIRKFLFLYYVHNSRKLNCHN